MLSLAVLQALIGGVLAASAAIALWPAGAVAQDPVAPRDDRASARPVE